MHFTPDQMTALERVNGQSFARKMLIHAHAFAPRICEINGDQMWFDAISRGAKVFDSGVITRRK